LRARSAKQDSPPISANLRFGLPGPEGQGLSNVTVIQHVAALRMLYYLPVAGQVPDDINPAHAVRGRKDSQERRQLPDREYQRIRF
jgi:hypothetical protein